MAERDGGIRAFRFSGQEGGREALHFAELSPRRSPSLRSQLRGELRGLYDQKAAFNRYVVNTVADDAQGRTRRREVAKTDGTLYRGAGGTLSKPF